MRVINPGHHYMMQGVDGGGEQPITFVRRRDSLGELLAQSERSGGVLCQEVLRVLIDRVLYLYTEDPCDEDTEIIRCLRRALVLFETRAARRRIEKLSMPERATVEHDGHIHL
jgi:hypothetical protein